MLTGVGRNRQPQGKTICVFRKDPMFGREHPGAVLPVSHPAMAIRVLPGNVIDLAAALEDFLVAPRPFCDTMPARRPGL
jgi:hypothetical protein